MTEELLYESKRSKLFYLESSEWGEPVVKKVLNYDFPTPLEISHFYNEFDILEGLQIAGIRKVLKRTKDKNRHAFLMEWVDAPNLKEAFQQKQNDVEDFLYIAIAIVQILEDLHDNGIIHKDINPFNILVNLQKRSVKLIDFSISSKIDLKQRYTGNPEYIEGTLAYNSPEQTGRMNRIIDYRTDLYSAGVTMYEMVSGHLPFMAKDPLELLHCHIAAIPKPASEVNPNVPATISGIIDRLLAKNAEDRYQSARGLRKDLEKCLSLFKEKGFVPAFPLAKEDYSGKFNIPQKLYGRQEEIKLILSAFEECAAGKLVTMWIAGHSGTGKSALVSEVCKPITGKKGYFVEGKFDQFQRSVPYFAIVEAFKELVNIFLTENETTLGYLRQKIQSAVGTEGQVLTKIIPNLENIIGTQPDVPEIGGAEAQNRFNYLVRKFVKAVAAKEHPLVLFIDDLQWADSASLSLLQNLATDPEAAYILCVGAYRDNEVNSSHAVTALAEAIRESGVNFDIITIGNLSEGHLNELIAETLNKESGEVTELTQLIYNKTAGNAFFIKQFLKSLYEEQLLVFDFKSRTWTWDIFEIRAKNISDNVVELMTGKILKLPPATQSVLKTVACMGNMCRIDTLALIQAEREEDIRKHLFPAMKEGLVVPIGDTNIKYSHDRIQQAVYSLVPEGKRNEVHLEIGRLLKKNVSDAEFEEQLFDITNQWNYGRGLLTDEQELEMLAALNLRTGLKAKTNSAFQPALSYFEIGISLLKTDAWSSQYSLCLNLLTEASEAAYLCADFEKTDYFFKEILNNASQTLDKIKPYEIRILSYKAENKLIEAINTGLLILEELGERFPKNPNMADVFKDLAFTFLKLRRKSDEEILNMPLMTDPRQLAVMRIIADITSSVYWARPNLIPLIVFRMLKVSLKYGNTGVSCFAYGSYGVLLCGVLGLMRTGYRYGKLSLALLDKLNVREWKAQIYCAPYALVFHWNEHVRNTLAPLKESYFIGMETGLIEFACINTNIYCIHSFLCGKPLEKVEQEILTFSQSYLQFKQETNYNYNEVYRQAVLNFMGKTADPTLLTGEAYDEVKMMSQNLERKDRTGSFFIHFNKLMLCYYFGEFEQARLHAEETRLLLDAVLSKFEIPNYCYYEALTLLALYPQAKPGNRRRLMARVRQNQKKLKNWSRSAPENFLHKYHLVEALERLKTAGKKRSEAQLFYDQAIDGAAKNSFTQEEALAYELAGKFYLELGAKDIAEYYLKAAYNTYTANGVQMPS